MMKAGVEMSSKVVQSGMGKTMGKDPFNMPLDKWSDTLAMKLTYIIGRLSGETSKAGIIALNMKKYGF